MRQNENSYEQPEFQEGDVVSFAVAAEIVRFLGDGFVEVKDEDGHGHEVPLRALRAAYPNVIERFERKRERRVSGEVPSRPMPRAVVAPQFHERSSEAPRHGEGGGRPDRREREQRREAKRRGY